MPRCLSMEIKYKKQGKMRQGLGASTMCMEIKYNKQKQWDKGLILSDCMVKSFWEKKKKKPLETASRQRNNPHKEYLANWWSIFMYALLLRYCITGNMSITLIIKVKWCMKGYMDMKNLKQNQTIPNVLYQYLSCCLQLVHSWDNAETYNFWI